MVETIRLTPYQGKRRACGMFHCEKCDKHWFSANSWANSYQKCLGCKGKIYPYRQFRPWQGSSGRGGAPQHPQDMCQKCIQIGQFCGRWELFSKS
uniref:Hemocyte homeostasis-associated protein n=1 Tax=Pacifastacus leniusculus TaxID=6720 RepID=E2JA36_PACLE|nr:hemocyte homeostasis-associated protein [Pacifastacus leniusculus]